MTQSIPLPPMDGRILQHQFAAELVTIHELVSRGFITDDGLMHVHWRLRQPGNLRMLDDAPLLANHYERVLHLVVVALSKASGVPESYWEAKPLLDAPDDISELLSGEDDTP